MNKNVNFANREVANMVLINYTDKKPFMYIDWANVTSTSFEAERVFATGGQGAPNRVQFDGSRTGTLTIEAQVYPVKAFQMLSGRDMDKTANIVQREKLTAASGLTLSETPVGDVQVYAADDDCGTELTCTVTDKNVTGNDIKDNSDYIVYYYTAVTDAQVVRFTSSDFPKSFRIEGETPFKTEDDEIIKSRHIWHKAAPQASFELAWQNTGDPASVTFTFDVMADADGNVYDQIFK